MASQSAARKREAPRAGVVLEEFLPYRLNVLATLVSNALARIYAERFGLTIPGWRIVATLGQYEGRTARDIAAHAVMHKSTVSRAVSALEERGLVMRKPNPDDMREERLALTDEGRAVYEALAPEALEFEQRALSALTAAEQRTFFDLVLRLDAQARRMAGAQAEDAERSHFVIPGLREAENPEPTTA